MVEKVGQHTHCHICGKAIPVDETLCSEECKERYQNMMKRGRWLKYIIYGLMFMFIVMLVFNMYGGR